MMAVSSPRMALVLAGGKGERLRPLTDDRPKPMVEVSGAPILIHHLRWLRDNGIERAIILTGYLQEVISDYFAVPRIDGITIECVAEKRPLGRGGAFRNGFNRINPDDEILVATNGDVITDQPLAEMLELHVQRNALATVLLVQMVSPYGIVEVSEVGEVRNFTEKPTLPLWINGGVYLLHRSVFSRMPESGDHETSTFPDLAREGKIAGLRSSAYWNSIESSKDLRGVAERLGGMAC